MFRLGVHSYAIILLSAFLLKPAQAQEVIKACSIEPSSSGFYSEPLQKYEMAPFRILYSTSGTNAIIDTTDINSNGVPDYVENIARQADFMRKALNNLGFRDPLESSRYRAAKYIDISVRDIGSNNGITYDEPAVYPNVPIKGNDCALLISISRNLQIFPGTWAVVGHEVFHVYQNSYSMFKPSWLTEATARWAEYLIRNGYASGTAIAPLPSTTQSMENNVYSQSYPMDFWNRLIELVDASSNNVVDLPSSVKNLKYVDGTSIMKDGLLKGAPLIKSILQSLEAESNVVTAVKSWPSYGWQESDQKDTAHNPRVLKVIQRTVINSGVNNPEITGFLSIP